MERVQGTIRNTTSHSLSVVHACAGIYDAAGTVIGTFPAFVNAPPGGLAPNATLSATVEVPIFGTPKTAKLIASGQP